MIRLNIMVSNAAFLTSEARSFNTNSSPALLRYEYIALHFILLNGYPSWVLRSKCLLNNALIVEEQSIHGHL